ncbi:MAG: dienelactone hydrolase family protein [Polyangiaceae bacterium]|nr:dienelactone hydrolase family protein [Polyangiaceae bacterium]
MAREIVTERVRIEVADGTAMDAFVARPADGGPHPGLLVIQEIFGVNAHIRDVTERFAREGYVALSPDLFHRQAPGYEAGYEDIPASIALAMKYSNEESEADLRAACDHLRGRADVKADRIGAIGYCMGGRLAFAANALAPLSAAVSYYGAGIASDKMHMADKLSGPMLFVWAGLDAYIPAEQHLTLTAELRRRGKPFVSVEFSSVSHGFFCNARSDYNAAAASQVWPLTLAFLRSHLGG